MTNVQEEWNEKCRAAALETQQRDYEYCRIDQENQAAETSALYQRYKEDKRKKEADRAATNISEVWQREAMQQNSFGERQFATKHQNPRVPINSAAMKANMGVNPLIAHNIANTVPGMMNNPAVPVDMLRNYCLPMMSLPAGHNEYNYAMAQSENFPFNAALINAIQMNKMANSNGQQQTVSFSANVKQPPNNQLQHQIFTNQQMMNAQNFNTVPKNAGYCGNQFSGVTVPNGQNFFPTSPSMSSGGMYRGFVPQPDQMNGNS